MLKGEFLPSVLKKKGLHRFSMKTFLVFVGNAVAKFVLSVYENKTFTSSRVSDLKKLLSDEINCSTSAFLRS